MSIKNTNRKTIEPVLVPMTMWKKNVRAVISKQNWEALRWSFGATVVPAPFTYKAIESLGLPKPKLENQLVCIYCKSTQEEMDLHEVWEYDDKKLSQKLVNLVPVCEECHLSLHLGYASAVNLEERAINNLSKVNNCTVKETKRQIKKYLKYGLVDQKTNMY